MPTLRPPASHAYVNPVDAEFPLYDVLDRHLLKNE